MGPGVKGRQYALYAAFLVLVAISCLLAYPRVNPGWALYRQAVNLARSGRAEEALPLFEQAVDQGVTKPAALLTAAEAALERGEADRADRAFGHLSAKARQDPGFLRIMAGLYDRFGLPERALAVYRSAALPPGDPAVLHQADLLRRASDLDGAKALYRKALDARPDLAEARFGLAETLGWEGRFDEARQEAEAYLSARPDSRQGRILLARLLSWEGRFDEAVDQYRKALGETP